MTVTVSVAALILRVVVGSIFIAEGSSKLWGFPKSPPARNLARMIGSRRFPAPALLATAVTVFEFGCGILLLTGTLTRLAALPLIGIMAMATFVFKRKDGFLGGWDWPFSVLGGTLAVFVLGAGAYSVDAALQTPYMH